ncbi:MAG: hypothetical protein P1V81_17540 [Planctomycetota bacterium]|nr:hypothetical protein [Planctomycetota bacterium]
MLHLLLTATLSLSTPGAPAALTPEPHFAQDPVEVEEEEPAPLEEWPAADKDTTKLISKELGRVRKAGTPEMAEGGRDALIEIGDAAGPALLKALEKERKEEARERIAEVLVALTDRRHSRLFAAEFDSKSEHVRLFALERASTFPDPAIRKQAEAAFAAAKEREGTKKEVKHELYFAALALCSSGSIEGLDVLHARALEDWGKCGQQVRAAIEALRGPEASERVAALLDASDRKATVAALRLLAGCGTKESAGPLVKPLLDSPDNSIRVAAINAARGIVDGEPPLDRLPVFEAVELANKWKARL